MTADLAADIIKKLARKGVTGGHNKQVDTVKNWFASSEQGRVEETIREMIADPSAPVERYGGSRDAIRLTSIRDARRYVEERDEEWPWWLDR